MGPRVALQGGTTCVEDRVGACAHGLTLKGLHHFVPESAGEFDMIHVTERKGEAFFRCRTS
jgi:hypothetical protein